MSLLCICNVIARFSATACFIFNICKAVTPGTLVHCTTARYLAQGRPTAPPSLPITHAARSLTPGHMERDLLRFQGRGGPGSVLPLSWPGEYRPCRPRPKAAVRVVHDRPHPPKMRVPLVLLLKDAWGTLSFDAIGHGRPWRALPYPTARRQLIVAFLCP